MQSPEIEIQLKAAEQAAVKQDKDAFKKVFPGFDSNPQPADWTGANGSLSWNKISKKYPHTRYKFLHEHIGEAITARVLLGLRLRNARYCNIFIAAWY